MRHVRLPLCKPEFVSETVSKDDLVKLDLECRDLVDEAKDYQLRPREKRQQMNKKRMQRRMAMHSGILFAGNLSAVNFADNQYQVACELFSGWIISQYR